MTEDDQIFILGLGLDHPQRDAQVALVLRGMLAEFSGVEREAVRCDATFDDLRIGVADCIDVLDFTLSLESALQVKFDAATLERIPNPDSHFKLPVRHFIAVVCAELHAMDRPERA